MRWPLCGVLVVALLVSGCDGSADASPKPSPTRSVAPPASAAGGACEQLDYAVIKEHLGVEFDVAAAGAQGDSLTCVVQRGDASYPDLVLSTTPTLIDAKIFGSTIKPKGAATVTGLGRSAYSASIPPVGDAGPGVEVGWLGANRVVLLRYKIAKDADPATLTEATPKLVALARRIEAPPAPAPVAPSLPPSLSPSPSKR